MRTSPASVVLALLIASGCGDDPPPEPTIEPLPRVERPGVAAGRPVATSSAFALVPSSDGALLVWAAPGAVGGGVRALPLGPVGQVSGPERRLVTEGAGAGGAHEDRIGQVVEVDAAAVGRRVGVAWVVDHVRTPEVESSYSLDGGATFTRPVGLGPTARLERGHGGRLSLAASADGALVLYHRIPAGPCVATEGTCARFTRSGIGTDETAATRGTEPLEVEHPCEPLVSGATFRDGTWYYAICHESPSPRVTTYVIRPEVAYAAAVESPPGCRPSAVAPLDRGVAILTECGEHTGALVLDSMGRELARLAELERSVRCVDGRPLLRLTEASPRFELHLGGAADHVEGLLPDSVAPRGSRAVWTGEALLVALPLAREVALRRYECVRGRFDRTDAP